MEESPQKELTVTTESQGHQINVRIRDTGCGLSEETQPHLFRPFFTTKGEKHFGIGALYFREDLGTYGAFVPLSFSERGDNVLGEPPGLSLQTGSWIEDSIFSGGFTTGGKV